MSSVISEPYAPPLDQFLALGQPALGTQNWLDYPGLGLRPEHVPELIRMARDEDLLWASGEDPDVWAPVHAWRALGQLRAEAAVEPLLALLSAMGEDDWIDGDLPIVFGMIGRAAVTALSAFLADSTREMWNRVAVVEALREIAERDEAARADVVPPLVKGLEKWYRNDEVLNGYLIGVLAGLHAVEAAPLMEQAFAEERVDPFAYGDWEDAQVALGLLAERRTPRPRLQLAPRFERRDAEPARSGHRGEDARAKSRRKMARQSRKRNRRRR
ncbi:MAG: DUF1186 domain-containing protein [Gemmatimonadetes bacterium]|nr:DUF1186 domain-containing protein [Gemmatimonadota bacterium]